METYPLCSRTELWHSAGRHVSTQQYADQGRKGIAFLAYCLTVTLRHRLRMHAPGLTPRAVLEKLAGVQMLDVSFPTTDGRRLVMPRYTEPDPEQALFLGLVLPQQPPPRITTAASSDPFPPLKM